MNFKEWLNENQSNPNLGEEVFSTTSELNTTLQNLYKTTIATYTNVKQEIKKIERNMSFDSLELDMLDYLDNLSSLLHTSQTYTYQITRLLDKISATKTITHELKTTIESTIKAHDLIDKYFNKIFNSINNAPQEILNHPSNLKTFAFDSSIKCYRQYLSTNPVFDKWYSSLLTLFNNQDYSHRGS